MPEIVCSFLCNEVGLWQQRASTSKPTGHTRGLAAVRGGFCSRRDLGEFSSGNPVRGSRLVYGDPKGDIVIRSSDSDAALVGNHADRRSARPFDNDHPRVHQRNGCGREQPGALRDLFRRSRPRRRQVEIHPSRVPAHLRWKRLRNRRFDHPTVGIVAARLIEQFRSHRDCSAFSCRKASMRA